MKYVTNLMINEFKLKQLKTDFMGYSLQKEGNTYTFHHLIIPRRECGRKHIPNDGYIRDNGAILFRNPHDYLHTIEHYDYDLFLAITSEMIDMNIKGHLDMENLLNIRMMLEDFEERFYGEKNKKGHEIVKPEYVSRRLVLKREDWNGVKR